MDVSRIYPHVDIRLGLCCGYTINPRISAGSELDAGSRIDAGGLDRLYG